MESEGSSPCSQKPATCPYPESDISALETSRFILILSSHLRLPPATEICQVYSENSPYQLDILKNRSVGLYPGFIFLMFREHSTPTVQQHSALCKATVAATQRALGRQDGVCVCVCVSMWGAFTSCLLSCWSICLWLCITTHSTLPKPVRTRGSIDFKRHGVFP
jgi:hypothetical protein